MKNGSSSLSVEIKTSMPAAPSVVMCIAGSASRLQFATV